MRRLHIEVTSAHRQFHELIKIRHRSVDIVAAVPAFHALVKYLEHEAHDMGMPVHGSRFVERDRAHRSPAMIQATSVLIFLNIEVLSTALSSTLWHLVSRDRGVCLCRSRNVSGRTF